MYLAPIQLSSRVSTPEEYSSVQILETNLFLICFIVDYVMIVIYVYVLFLKLKSAKFK